MIRIQKTAMTNHDPLDLEPKHLPNRARTNLLLEIASIVPHCVLQLSEMGFIIPTVLMQNITNYRPLRSKQSSRMSWNSLAKVKERLLAEEIARTVSQQDLNVLGMFLS